MPKREKIRAAAAPALSKIGANVLDVRLDVPVSGWQQYFLLSSDRHHDSIDCDRELEIEQLELARERKAIVLDFGDLFDAMQGKYDPRRSYPSMRSEYVKRMQDEQLGYLDVIVKDAVEFYRPYADLFGLVAVGNHETSILSHNDVSLIDKFVYGLNTAAGANVHKGAYGGWVVFHFSAQGKAHTRRLKYFHGSGGGGIVTKGVIQSNRQAVFLPDADIVVNGHIHESWLLTLARERISDRGVVYNDLQQHVRTATYKDDYRDGSGGWHVERGMPPKPRGSTWLRFWYENSEIRLSLTQDVR